MPKLLDLNNDTNPTNILTFNPINGDVQFSSKSLVSTPTKATVALTAPSIATSKENDTWIQTISEDDGSGTFFDVPRKTYVFVNGAWYLQSWVNPTKSTPQVPNGSIMTSNADGSIVIGIISMNSLAYATPVLFDTIPFALLGTGVHKKVTLATLKTVLGVVNKSRIVQPIIAGANTITDNLALLTPFARTVEVRDNTTGELIACRITNEQTNTYVLTSNVAISSARITTLG